MIKSDKGELTVDGKNIELLFELGHIIENFSQESPVELLAVLTYHTEDLEEALENSDRNLLRRITEFYREALESTKE